MAKEDTTAAVTVADRTIAATTAVMVDRVKYFGLTNNLSVSLLKFIVLFIFGLDYAGKIFVA